MEKLLPVTKVASDYTKDELVRFREEFAPVVQRYHQFKHRSNVVSALILGSSFIILAIVVMADSPKPKNTEEWFDAIMCIFVGCLALELWLSMLVLTPIFLKHLPRFLKCPACQNHLEVSVKRLGSYCPECGSDQLEKVGRFIPPKCNECDKFLWSGSRKRGGPYRRYYKIRYCTHCGVLLDEKGF